MGFRELIERVVQEVPGCVNCTLLGYDGIAIDTIDVPREDLDVNSGDAIIEYANLVAQVRSAAQSLGSGEIQEVCIRNERMTTVLRALTDEYLVAATFAADGLIGKGRYMLRVIAPSLREELL